MKKENTNILLVEDDAVNQLVASLILRQQGMNVTIANNGEEALTQISSKAFQLILMDIQMPTMDGYEATTRIRAMSDPYFKTVPIIAFTASASAEVQAMAENKGMNDLISKPLDLDELQSKMEKYKPEVHRPLSIDFNVYTDGNPDFKQELISHMIDNVRELQCTLVDLGQNAIADFLQVLHKVKATVTMLNDSEFTEALEDIKSFVISSQPLEFLHRKVKSFNRLCNQLIASLAAEAKASVADIT